MVKKSANRTHGTHGAHGAHGYTLVELMTVLAIMAILGTMLVSMLNTGSKFYRSADSTMDSQNNARIATAYITVKIRQNDVANGISVVSLLDSSSNSLQVLKIRDSSMPPGNTFWIYFDSNTKKLREQSDIGFNPVLGNGTEITDLSYFNIVQSGANLHFEVKSVDGMVNLAQDITLRSP